MRLFGVPKREESEPVEAEAPQLDSARSVGSGESPAQSSKNSDNASFGQMKLVIKNTFIGGYEEDPEDDPPRTLARSASDSKLDCTSSASSVLFWYPQRKDSMSRSNSSVMSRSDAEDIEDSHLIEHGPAGPYHMVYGRSRATEGSRQSVRPPQDFLRHRSFSGTEVASDMPNHVPAPDDLRVPHSRLSMEHAHRPPGNFFGGSIPRPPGMFDGPLQQLAAAQPNIQGGMTGQGNYTGDMLPQEGAELLDMELVKMQAMQAELQKLTATRAGSSHQHPELAQMPMSSSANASFRISNFPVPKSDFMAQAVAGDLQLPPGGPASANVAEQQLHHQLLESQMQQLQLQQQMQQLQVQTQRLQQQLAGQQTTGVSQPSDEDALLSQIPFNDEGERASLGSRLHPDNCNPCIFWFKDKTFCNKGIMCDFCHFRHPGQKNKRIRPSKNTRLQMRAAQAARGGAEISGLA
ncbi:unnamed protein product [Symbiodinium sp. CCMP2592]|nr:unnamed protein product [Symbiodinium sp. CCMP2592]